MELTALSLVSGSFQQGDSSDVDDPVTVDLLVDVVPAPAEETSSGLCDEISVIESVQLSQYEADINEAVQRSIEDQSRAENILSQPGCSHWPVSLPPLGPQSSAQGGPPSPSSTPSSGPPPGQASSGIAALPEVTSATVPVSSQVQAGIRQD